MKCHTKFCLASPKLRHVPEMVVVDRRVGFFCDATHRDHAEFVDARGSWSRPVSIRSVMGQSSPCPTRFRPVHGHFMDHFRAQSLYGQFDVSLDIFGSYLIQIWIIIGSYLARPVMASHWPVYGQSVYRLYPTQAKCTKKLFWHIVLHSFAIFCCIVMRSHAMLDADLMPKCHEKRFDKILIGWKKIRKILHRPKLESN